MRLSDIRLAAIKIISTNAAHEHALLNSRLSIHTLINMAAVECFVRPRNSVNADVIRAALIKMETDGVFA